MQIESRVDRQSSRVLLFTSVCSCSVRRGKARMDMPISCAICTPILSYLIIFSGPEVSQPDHRQRPAHGIEYSKVLCFMLKAPEPKAAPPSRAGCTHPRPHVANMTTRDPKKENL